jgi:hypothetical protein
VVRALLESQNLSVITVQCVVKLAAANFFSHALEPPRQPPRRQLFHVAESTCDVMFARGSLRPGKSGVGTRNPQRSPGCCAWLS